MSFGVDQRDCARSKLFVLRLHATSCCSRSFHRTQRDKRERSTTHSRQFQPVRRSRSFPRRLLSEIPLPRPSLRPDAKHEHARDTQADRRLATPRSVLTPFQAPAPTPAPHRTRLVSLHDEKNLFTVIPFTDTPVDALDKLGRLISIFMLCPSMQAPPATAQRHPARPTTHCSGELPKPQSLRSWSFMGSRFMSESCELPP